MFTNTLGIVYIVFYYRHQTNYENVSIWTFWTY